MRSLPHVLPVPHAPAALVSAILMVACGPALAAPPPERPPGAADVAPLDALDTTLSPMRALVERYAADRAALDRFYDVPMSTWVAERRQTFHQAWLDALASVDFDGLDLDGRVDHVLFGNLLRYGLRALEHERTKLEEVRPILPFAPTLVELQEARRRLDPVDAPAVAASLAGLAETVRELREALEASGGAEAAGPPARGDAPGTTVAWRAARQLDALRDMLRGWYRFYERYDPLFTWWVRAPYETLEPELEAYAATIRRELAGVSGDDEDDAIVGDPIGREDLLSRLAYEMIPYTPEELIDIARREYDWCRREMIAAARALGFDDDWHRALDHVKGQHVEPGRQPELIRDLAFEAVEFLEARDLLTIPELCKETWRMEMMSPARQKVSPYFLGGEVIIVSFPTDTMEHDDKLMSMRGNNRHFARATVHHELIPGHHLQGFMTARHRTHRRIFGTPFWLEGWALYWEMRLWDLDFPRSPENRIGMLFWRMHRCARIIFSLGFHLGEMTPAEAIDFLVENVGHERNNATAEVRRSVSGDYGPLYQAAYMLGGLQIRALRRELVESGRMSERRFHDAVLEQNSIPIEMVRAALREEPPAADFVSSWRFYEE